MTRAGLLLMLATIVVGGCDRAPDVVRDGDGPALERAAREAGVISAAGPAGVFASDTDRVCLLPLPGGTYRAGASVDYGENQRCIAHGTASDRADGTLAVDFGAGCSVNVTLDGDRLSFPAVVPEGCERRCVGRASLAALIADRLSDSRAEAAAARDPDGKPLCAG